MSWPSLALLDGEPALPAAAKRFIHADKVGDHRPLALHQLVFRAEEGALGFENTQEVPHTPRIQLRGQRNGVTVGGHCLGQ
jgi:hypothetical protein